MSPTFEGSIIGLRPEYAERYVALHAHTFPGVLKRISQSNIRNYAIFLHQGTLFSHMEYSGSDRAADMAAIAADATTRQWWTLTDPMQTPLPERSEGERWASLRVQHAYQAEQRPGSVQRLAFVFPRHTGPKTPEDALRALPDVHTLRVFEARDHFYAYAETRADTDPANASRALQQALGAPAPLQPMAEVFHTDGLAALGASKKVFVSGCFDMLHSGHVAFLTEAAQLGDLYVGIGSDTTVCALKGRRPVTHQNERRYMLEALSSVHQCRINAGSGVMDFVADLDEVTPDIFVVNTDGDTPAKRALCAKRGMEYRVLDRVPAPGLPARSTTALRARTSADMPFRIDLAGGWLDQPFVSKLHAGPVLTISIEPTVDFNDRSGMASSTRRKALELWGSHLPHGDPVALGRVLFAFENPPGTQEVAGSQDALGIVLPGLNRLHYQGDYWPARMDHVLDEDVLTWLEQRLYLVALGPRAPSYSVLADTRIQADGARELSLAAEACWDALLRRDAAALGQGMRRSFEAQVSMFPRMLDENIASFIEANRDRALGYKLSGAGGGGYLILVADTPVPGATTVQIRRQASL